MKVFLFTAITVLSAVLSSAQTSVISGRILDAGTLEPLPFTNVFINHTTLGAAADDKGLFILNGLPSGEVEIVFSFVGYQSYQTKVVLLPNKVTEMVVKLVEDKEVLKDVQVTGKRDDDWERGLKTFTRTFVGETKGPLLCKITNPWVLEFRQGAVGEANILFAEASSPLKIENLSLGYSITYYLTRFTASPQSYLIEGSVRFEEMLSNDTELLTAWSQNRTRAYSGSYRHLFHAILNKRVKDEGFRLFNLKDKPAVAENIQRSNYNNESSAGEEIDPAEIEVDPGRRTGEFVLVFKRKSFMVQYQGKDASVVELKSGVAQVNSNGIIVDPRSMILSGHMSESRVSQLLPDNFVPARKSAVVAAKSQELSSATEDLRESVYVSTDKPYYYPGEMIWLNAFMMYANPAKKDTLSRLLNVELIDSKKTIVHSVTYRISNGEAAGNIFIADSLVPGNYYIRAYTQWMRNYGDEALFVKPLVICSPLDRVTGESIPVVSKSQAIDASIETDRQSYGLRDKIFVSVGLTRNGEGVPGVFSVSVIDTRQVSDVSVQPSITSMTPRGHRLSEKNATTFGIEYGVSLRGKIIDVKDRSKKTITIVQGNNEDFASVQSDLSGNFSVSGFQFIDSADFAFQVKDVRKKIVGKVMLEHNAAPVNVLPSPPGLVLEHKTTRQRAKIDYTRPDDSKMLQDVVVQSTRIENSGVVKKYSQPSYTMDGEWIAKKNFGNLLDALKYKVPSLRVIPYLDGGTVRYTVTFDVAASNTEPLLLVDGLPYFASPPDGIYPRLIQFNMSTIDHVDVLKFVGSMDYGVRTNGGVIAVYTKRDDAVKGPVNSFDERYFQKIRVKGYSLPEMFPYPDYSKGRENSDQPDLRSTIHWEPGKATDKYGKSTFVFYSADLSTTYKIIIEGMTDSGEPFHHERLIEVK